MKRSRIGYVILSSSSWALQPKAITSQRLGPQNDVDSTNPNDDVLYPLQELSADRYKSTISHNVTLTTPPADRPCQPQYDSISIPRDTKRAKQPTAKLTSATSMPTYSMTSSNLLPISHNVTLTTPPADRPCQPQYDSVSIPRDTKRAKQPTAKLTSATSMPTYSMTSSNLLPVDTSKPKITKISRIVLRREIDPKTRTPHRNRDSKPPNL
ncbi:cyclic pyranopterin monophosphate synthase accessory protein, mitochondrial-like [Dorcoceras hygrometricum]|uniref:Cyclic pyranopterin monophosphate synthase accessory protein, mitochondrial-like n=1 Tax=Dorcoceras hygrometricum TaxID=472368 RepID=A0A2Z7AAM2_9LAMI|nr:cyclic pyranopterin monophosphate synthase accessory protein, mitochondrial-like [Dorcoceras hygrometricum]